MRIVVKIGTSTLAHSSGHLNIRRVEELCKIMSDIKNAGHEVILVSSGAIGMGMGKLHLHERPKTLPEKDVFVNEKPSYRHRAVCIEGAVSYEHVADMIDFLPKIAMNGYFVQFKKPYVFFERWYDHWFYAYNLWGYATNKKMIDDLYIR